MIKKLFQFVVGQHKRVFCFLAIQAMFGYKISTIDQPVDWYSDLVAYLMIIAVVYLTGCIFWYFFIREQKNKVTITYAVLNQPLEYHCLACDQTWIDGQLPPGRICPSDGLPLVSYDPVEDRNSYPL